MKKYNDLSERFDHESGYVDEPKDESFAAPIVAGSLVGVALGLMCIFLIVAAGSALGLFIEWAVDNLQLVIDWSH